MASRVKVHGTRRLDRNLKLLGKNIIGQMVEPVVEGMQIVEEQAEKNVRANGNVLTGDLSRGYGTRAFKKTRTQIGAETGAVGKARANAHLIEFGVSAHFQPTRSVFHPGHAAYPALTPALVTKQREVVDHIRRQHARKLEMMARRLKR